MSRRDENTPPTEEQRARAERGAALVAAAVGDPQARAPAALREAIERDRARAAATPARSGRFGVARGRLLAGAGALAAVLVALVIALGGLGEDGPGGPSVVQVAAVGRLPATAPAPPAVPRTARLAAAVEGLPFPDWQPRFAWTATGRRTDELAGRAVSTVFYRNAKGARLGYSIVAGDPVGGARAGRDVVRGGTRYRVARGGGRTTVSWTQEGHTCVIDAPSAVPAAKLVELAAWGNA